MLRVVGAGVAGDWAGVAGDWAGVAGDWGWWFRLVVWVVAAGVGLVVRVGGACGAGV